MSTISDGLSTVIAGTEKLLGNPIATAVGGAVLGAGVAGTVVAVAKRRKKSRAKATYKKNKKSSSKRKGRRTPRTAGKGKDRSTKRIRYTKKGQPYVITKSGKAKFIKKSGARRSHKLKGGRY